MRMNRVVFLTLLLLIVENAIIPWMIPSDWGNRLLPHLSFIFVLFTSAFAGRHKAFFLGLSFGFLQDMLSYGLLIGPYSLGMGLIGYLAGLVFERRPPTLGFIIWMVFICGIVLDTIIFGLYSLFRITSLQYIEVLYWQIAPTSLLQLLIALILYVPVRRFTVIHSLASNEEDKE